LVPDDNYCGLFSLPYSRELHYKAITLGAEDRLTPPGVAIMIHNKYKTVSTYREFNRPSHFIIAEPGWEEAASTIEAWIAGHKQTI
jgi:hypothetical protein